MRTIVYKLMSGLCLLFLAVRPLAPSAAWSHPVSSQQVERLVLSWIGLHEGPLGVNLGKRVKRIETYDYEGAPAYYVVYMAPAGMIIVAADDLVEPIIAFSSAGSYSPFSNNPLGALVNRDIPDRVARAREAELGARGGALTLRSAQAEAHRRWVDLESLGSGLQKSTVTSPGIADVRIAPLVQTRWDQSTVNGQACYNYFTPPYSVGSVDNYACGCVATAMAQLMRYWRYPAAPVGGVFFIRINGALQPASIRGGDGYGGDYDWSDMTVDPPASGVSAVQAAAIGALAFDAGVATQMWYSTSSSGSDLSQVAGALTSTFKYSNAKFAGGKNGNLSTDSLKTMINPDLDARYPVLLAITTSTGIGHAIVCDGYGYVGPTLYHHLNMGWSGLDDAWYNLPDVNTTGLAFSAITECIYNVFTTGSGEIVSGRVTDSNGVPIGGAAVTASGGYAATTDSSGIYALTHLPSNTLFSIAVTKAGYLFASQSATTGASVNATSVGNVWGVDFVGASLLPSVTTKAASSITRTGAQSGGEVISEGGSPVTAKGVCWSISPNPGTSGSCVGAGGGAGSFVSALSGLRTGTNYHLRAYATNGDGTAYGNDIQFRTAGLKSLPWLELLLQ